MPSPFDAAAAAFPHTEASSSIDVTDSMLINSKPSAIDVTDSMLVNSKPSAVDVTDSMLVNSKPSAVDVTDSILSRSKPSRADAGDEEFSVDEATSSINVTDAMIIGSKPSHAGAVPSMPLLELESDEELETSSNSPVVGTPASSIASMIEDGAVAFPRAGITDAVATRSPSGARSSDHELTPSASTFAPKDLTDQSKRLGAFASKKAFVLRAAIIAGVVSFGGLVGLFVYSGASNDDSGASIQAAATPSKPDIQASPRAEPATPRPADVTAPQRTNQETLKPVAPEVTRAAPSADGKSQAIADAAPKPSGEDSAKSVDTPTIPDYVNKPTLLFVSDVAVRRSQRCHPQGHAVGTAQLFVTFSPNGRVSAARLEGEPLASAPVAKCILSHARAIQMPKFKGQAFTHVISVTLR
ncbi:MAG TPA: hypothetical protein VKP30_28395 [Polyangiaceae bacterium]|nr:hypothetical protein [Polyangiaceae bacterium]